MATFQTGGHVAKPNNPLYRTGKKLKTVNARHAIAAATASNGDIFILADGLTVDSRVHRLNLALAIPNTAGANDIDVGFYKWVEGALVAVNADVLIDGASITSGQVVGDLLRINTTLNRYSTVGNLTGLNANTAPANGLVLAARFNAKPTADVVVDIDVVIDEATIN